jgi:hypothetical protein
VRNATSTVVPKASLAAKRILPIASFDASISAKGRYSLVKNIIILAMFPVVLGLFRIPLKLQVLLLTAVLVPDVLLFYALSKFRPVVVVFRSLADVTDTREQRTKKLLTIGATAFVSVLGTLFVQFMIRLLWTH